MNEAEYIARLIRPDVALFRQPRKRSLCERLFYWGNRDERLRQMFIRAPMPIADREWFAEAALEWVHDYVLPVYQGNHDAPQTAAQTLELLTGDCEDGAILLATMIVSALDPAAWPCAKFCVGTVDGQPHHAFLTWRRTDLEETVLLDWTMAPNPLTRDDVIWCVDSEVAL